MPKRWFDQRGGFPNIEVLIFIALLMVGISIFLPNLHLGFLKALLKTLEVEGIIVGSFAGLILGAWLIGLVVQRIGKGR